MKTPFIAPDTPWNKSENIMVGGCDNGPLTYGVGYADDGSGAMVCVNTIVFCIKDKDSQKDEYTKELMSSQYNPK